jgi:hypothetical protein
VGYGDIPIWNKREFMISIPLMFLGVIIYSKIMTEVVAEMDKRLVSRMIVDIKKTDLKKLCQAIGEDMKEKEERDLIKEIENSVKTDYNTEKK